MEQANFLAGTAPVSRYLSMASSTELEPRLWPVWPSASREIRTDPCKYLCMESAHLYGVAGSRVVPTITIGLGV